MDKEKNLIIIDSKDRTTEIDNIDEYEDKIHVNFFNSKKIYKYSKEKVIIRNNPKMIDTINVEIYNKNGRILNVSKVFEFDEYTKIIYKNNNSDIFMTKDLTFSSITNTNNSHVIDYFKEISCYTTGNNNEYDNNKITKPFLQNEYEKLNYIDNESILNYYLNQNSLKTNNIIPDNIIYPFGFNLSQKEALENIFKSNISIINGPPGTGKTQTILNIITNLAIMHNKSIAVVSNNNEAVKNVKEKLEKANYGFLCASLGKESYRKNFFENKPEINIDDFNTNIPIDDLYDKLKSLNTELDQLLKINNKKAILSKQIYDYELEQSYYNKFYKNKKVDESNVVKCPKTSSKIMDLLIDIELIKDEQIKHKFIYKIIFFIKYGIKNMKKIKVNYINNLLYLQKMFYETKIKELKDSLKQIKEKLDNANFESTQKRHQEISNIILKNAIFNKYLNQKNDFTFENYKDNFNNFLKIYPIVLSTTYSLRNSISKDFMFDYVIIDEASQVDLLAGSLALSCAKNAVIVGDEKQLPQITNKSITKKISKYHIDSFYDYFENSILSAIRTKYNTSIPSKTLKEHYRCHPQIIEFNNKRYYNGELIAFANKEHSMEKKPLILYYSPEGNHARSITILGKNGTYNQRELDIIKQEVLTKEKLNTYKDEDVGITTPFRLQANKLSDSLDNIQSDTIHKYQGREKKLMIMSTVLDSNSKNSKKFKFVDDANMVNVAVSRAINQFVLVTDNNLFNDNGNEINALIKYIKYNNKYSDINKSNLVSVFDLLYKEHSKKLDKFSKKLSNISLYNSENIIDTILKDIFKSEKYNDYIYQFQGKLINFFQNLDNLTKREREYVESNSTVDFFIYDINDMQLKLAIEVNGFKFHENNIKQIERDKLKQSIFKKNNVPLIILRTNDYVTKENLEKEINNILLKKDKNHLFI